MQTELHRHLDVSIRLSTLLELAQARDLEAGSTSLERFREKIVLRRPLKDLAEVLAQFTLCQKVLDRPEVLERVAFETVEDCLREGSQQVELRFSPSFVSEYNGLSWDDVLAAFEAGLQRAQASYPSIRAGLICIASRDFGTEAVAETVEFFLRNRNRFIGFDLAGNEAGFPCRDFEGVMKPLRSAGASITIHAGEGAGPENMWEAVDLLGAQRIGHGLAAERDPKLMERLRRDSICLEMCPTSNWLTQATRTFEEHPLPRVLRAGVPVTINTDDPSIFGNTMPGEIHICREKMGMSDAEISQCLEHAAKASFLRS